MSHRAIERELLAIENLDLAATRLGLPIEHLLAEPYSYVDRFGVYKAPFNVAAKVAQHCCKRFAREVLRYLKEKEDDLRRVIVASEQVSSNGQRLANGAGRDQAEARLKEMEKVFALVRG